MKKILRRLYDVLPFKRELFSLLRKFWRPSDRLLRHLHFKGVITVMVEEGITFRIHHFGYQLENEIFWKGLMNGWEKHSVTVWARLCRHSKTVLDVGANTGLFALMAKALNPSAAVHAFEPVKRVADKLRANNDLNGYDITVVEKAASASTGTAVIYDTMSEHIYSVTVNRNLTAPGTNVTESTIETITLDDYVRDCGITRVDLVKIDVETHEPEVIEGFRKQLAASRPALLIEILGEESAEKIQALVNGLDYVYFNIDENSGIRRVPRISASDSYNFLICTEETARLAGVV
jgi:FkbM family methyltransferase